MAKAKIEIELNIYTFTTQRNEKKKKNYRKEKSTKDTQQASEAKQTIDVHRALSVYMGLRFWCFVHTLCVVISSHLVDCFAPEWECVCVSFRLTASLVSVLRKHSITERTHLRLLPSPWWMCGGVHIARSNRKQRKEKKHVYVRRREHRR